ncbi:hypothetical protein ACA689_001835 [Vibrio vulnificus]|uniref:hypothetical protein n=1 Tax=Vibrio vulnificus TaxID=672 RepID=UPI0007351AF6|nr:hypothetical protein [Vibrio vulnificus]EHU9443802.1 hypothetical protein [Vibrio vulnificus]PNM58901.1 hypothetical protein AL546_009885 [Vibrio vulnificus]SUP13914.1 Uncharacterised protein [Vibrio vulnificus]
MTWITLPSVSVQNGSKIVTVNNTQTTNIKVGDALLIGNYQPVEIAGVFATQLSLRTNWSNAAQANASAVVMPTFGDFNAATQALRQATQVTQGNFKTLEDWGTKLGNITFEGQDNSKHTARTLLQMDADVSELEEQANNLLINISGRGFARSEADMHAMREANKTKYAASGMVHTGRAAVPNASQGVINEGMWHYAGVGSENKLYLGRNPSASSVGSSKTTYPVMYFAGFEVHIVNLNNADPSQSSIKFPEAPDGTVTYDSSTGAVVKHPDAATAFASESMTNKVVTDRFDLAGYEPYLEKITADKPYIYPFGLIQSQEASVDGIATTVDNIRPITYFAVFDGDETSRGRGWNVNELTDAQKEKIFSNPKHNIFRLNTGELVQFRVRQRTIAGVGNGGWGAANIGINAAMDRYLGFSTNLFVHAQGSQDTVLPVDNRVTYFYESNVSGHSEETGIYQVNLGKDAAVDGLCFFYVICVVPRLNQGGYHPLNLMGSRAFVADNLGATRAWDHQNVISTGNINSKADCFNVVSSPIVGWPYLHSGRIGTSNIGSGRPDGRYYNAIYSSGLGGVVDLRLSSLPITIEDYFKAIEKNESGLMRGLMSLPRTFIDKNTDGDNVSGSGFTPTNSISEYKIGDTGYIEGVDGVFRPYKVAQVTTIVQFESPVSRKAGGLIVNTTITNISVSGDFLAQDVVGEPSYLYEISFLKNGWFGCWIPVIPDGTSRFFELKCKKRSSLPIQRYGGGNGDIWESYPTSHPWNTEANGATNGFTTSTLKGTVILYNYIASAKVSKPSIVKPVYGSKSGFGRVWASAWNAHLYGGLLVESLLGKVPKNNASTPKGVSVSLPLLDFGVFKNGAFDKASYAFPVHANLSLSAPTNNSPAIKVLPHAVSENGQAWLGFFWNEIKHDGMSWNDDGIMRVTDGNGTYNNLKPETCDYGYAISALPIGWVANYARFGTQVLGVDL